VLNDICDVKVIDDDDDDVEVIMIMTMMLIGRNFKVFRKNFHQTFGSFCCYFYISFQQFPTVDEYNENS
jgi:hypothetical protein